MMEETQWYCLHTKPRNERLTSQFLRSDIGLEVFCPLIRFERARSSGKLWVTEAMFPGYVFAKFSYAEQYRRIRAARGVIRIVGFGDQATVVPEGIVRELRLAVKDEETIVIESGIKAGEEVHVVAGPFKGLRALVSRVLPARDRVAVLLEVLGMEREVEVSVDALLPDLPHPMVKEE